MNSDAVRDPVCGMTLERADAAASSEWLGLRHHFCSETCRRAFDADPGAYLKREGQTVARRSVRIPLVGLACAAGDRLPLEGALRRVPGVLDAYVNPVDEAAYLTVDPELVPPRGRGGRHRAARRAGRRRSERAARNSKGRRTMTPRLGRIRILGVSAVALTVAGCAGSATGLEEPAVLLSVSPAGGAIGVSATVTVRIAFDHAMGLGMDAFAALHEGDVTGPEVPGVWTFSGDRATMTFTPNEPLAPATPYVIHLGGGMLDDHGNAANLERHGIGMGGQWATGSMMMGPGDGGAHMGDAWRHPGNGTYGMVFAFTTAA